VRSLLLPVACLAAAGAIGIAALVDHHEKQARINEVQVDEYFCKTQGTRCGYEPWQRIEDRWQTRQAVYEIAVIALTGLALALTVYRVTRRSSWRSAR
jgi:hypothetical protein